MADQEFLSLTGHLMNLINTFCILPVQLVECELCVQDRQNMMCGVGNKIIVCLVPGLHLALKKIVEDESLSKIVEDEPLRAMWASPICKRFGTLNYMQLHGTYM